MARPRRRQGGPETRSKSDDSGEQETDPDKASPVAAAAVVPTETQERQAAPGYRDNSPRQQETLPEESSTPEQPSSKENSNGQSCPQLPEFLRFPSTSQTRGRGLAPEPPAADDALHSLQEQAANSNKPHGKPPSTAKPAASKRQTSPRLKKEDEQASSDDETTRKRSPPRKRQTSRGVSEQSIEAGSSEEEDVTSPKDPRNKTLTASGGKNRSAEDPPSDGGIGVIAASPQESPEHQAGKGNKKATKAIDNNTSPEAASAAEPKSALRNNKKGNRKKRVSIDPFTGKGEAKSKRKYTRKNPPPTVAAQTNDSAGKAPGGESGEPLDTLAATLAQEAPASRTSRASKERLRKTVNSLHKEMEVAHYTRVDGSNLRRAIAKSNLAAHREARKSLEEEDEEEMLEHQGMYETSKRLRCSRVAEVNTVDEVTEDDDGETTDHGEATDHGETTDRGETDHAETEYETENKKATPKRKMRGKRRFKSKGKARMKAFRSQRLAQRQGEAIGLHIQGRNNQAIQKLKQLAADVPSAPQVYSDLGTVYEAMLNDLQQLAEKEKEEEDHAVDADHESDEGKDPSDLMPSIMRKQIGLAKKAYGAFHVAAILFKKDYSLWVRAADLSTRIAGMYDDLLRRPNVPEGVVNFARREQKRWLMEAKHDYQAADKLQPPGIEVGAKLATVAMELGNLSEALTLLTDMKGRKNLDTSRSEFDSSYRIWLLYADLMLRIGCECQQWNKQDESNNDYMLRRWLRKHSKTFDWRERRLQALVKALEVAAGTKACASLLVWLGERVSNDVKSPAEKTGEIPDVKRSVGTADREKETTENSANPPCDVIEEDKALLREKHEDELANFDKTTADMKLPEGSNAERLRAVERSKVVNRPIPDIAMDEKKSVLTDPTSDSTEHHLPISGSVGTVCDIALVLMSLMIKAGLYEGCIQTAEAVSLYLKERSRLVDSRRTKAAGRVDSIEPENGATYDMLDATSDGEDSVVLLTDDENLEELAEDRTLDSMRRGVLPPLHMALYGLALLASGKRKFLAVKCIESIIHLPKEDVTRNDHNADGTNRADARSIFLLEHSKFDDRTSILALVGRMLFRANDDKVTLGLKRLFEYHDMELTSSYAIADYPLVDSRPSQPCVHRLSCTTVVSASLTHCLYREVAKAADPNGDLTIGLHRSLKRTTKLASVLWVIQEDALLPEHVLLALKSVSNGLRELCRVSALDIKEVKQDVELWLSRFISTRITDLTRFKDNPTVLKCVNLPLDVYWLTSVRSKIALLCHNLAVGNAVECFSGWERREFSQKSLRGGYVGLRTCDGRVCGLVSNDLRLELIRQWSTMQRLLPDFGVSGRVADLLRNIECADWYREESHRLRDPDDPGNVGSMGETEGLWICLLFSRISLALAESGEEDSVASFGHVFNSMSVLFPLSQFTVNERLWGSDIGVVAEGTRIPTVAEKRPLPVAAVPPVLPDYTRPAKKRRQKKTSPYFLFDCENDDVPLSNLILLSNSKCTELWGQEEADQAQISGAREAMTSLHQKMRLLRYCYSVEGVERASLEIAAGLLAVAAYPACENVFLVLNQAANFASKGRRGGNNDRLFKGGLPEDAKCTPREMLVVLGRADCLHAIGFVAEASFLVSFVAKACRLRRRDREQWDDRWKLVAIHAYNISVMARSSKSSVFGDVYSWNDDVIEELKDARNDGLSIFGLVQADILPEEEADDSEDEEGTGNRKRRKLVTANTDPDLADDEDEYDEEADSYSDGSDGGTVEKRAATKTNRGSSSAGEPAVEDSGDRTALLPEEAAQAVRGAELEPQMGWSGKGPEGMERNERHPLYAEADEIVEL